MNSRKTVFRAFLCVMVLAATCAKNEYQNAQPLPVCSECSNYAEFLDTTDESDTIDTADKDSSVLPVPKPISVKSSQVFGACWKNDNRDTVLILFNIRQTGNMTLTIFNEKDQIITTLVDRALSAGKYVYSWVPPEMGKIYVLEAYFNDHIQRIKIWFIAQ